MPAARHCSRSLGQRVGGHGDDLRPAPRRPARVDAAGGLSPSISGIWTSMRTTSYGCRSAPRAPRGRSPRRRPGSPASRAGAAASCWLTALSSATRIRSGDRARRRRLRSLAGHGRRRGHARAQRAEQRVVELRRPDRLRQSAAKAASAPPRAGRATSAGSAGARARPGAGSRAPSATPSSSGICMSSTAASNGSPRRDPLERFARGRRRRGRRIPHDSRYCARGSARFVALSSTTSTRLPCRRVGVALVRRRRVAAPRRRRS